MSIPTPHIGAKKGELAKTVFMPGDPLRAKYIAENFLESPSLVNEIRGMLAYTGTYKGKPVSVMGSGMGCPSMGIYSYELFNFYDVENIVRIGSAGSIDTSLQLGDIVMAIGACTESNYPGLFSGSPGTFAPVASYELMKKAQESAAAMDTKLHVGNVLTSDVFYGDSPTAMKIWQSMGVLAVEMEAAALYTNAAKAGKNALCICTISDKVFNRDEYMSAKERETTFTQMMGVALGML